MADEIRFLETERALPQKESPTDRVQHYKEFYKSAEDGLEVEQASRCMDCGVPFCHSACPLGNLIPDFNEAVYNNDWRSAYTILSETNNFPEFTGRICPAPCESSCVLGINEDAVTIEFIEKSIIEKAFKSGWVKPQVSAVKTGKKIAIIGSGPAGLACADQLNKKGHDISVFEKNDKPGGLLRYGIPDFKLEKNIVDRRIDLLEKEGIEFFLNKNIGVDVNVTDVVAQYEAVVLCGGAEQPRDLDIEGRSLKGIHFAMDYLEQCNRRVAGKTIDIEKEIIVKRKNIVVIGGGDTGSDCIGNSNRLGAETITQIELLAKPPSDRTAENPWPLWPMTLKNSSSHEEGCERSWSILTKRFVSDDGVNLSGIETVKVSWEKDIEGKYKMQEIEGTSGIIPCDIVFLAVGFLHPLKEGLLSQLALELDNRGNVLTTDYKSSAEKIFSAGDMRRGQSLVVWAIAEGRACAEVVDAFLNQEIT